MNARTSPLHGTSAASWRAAAFALTLFLAACGPSSSSPVGSWKATLGSDRYEFLEDGTVLAGGVSGQWRKASADRYVLNFQMYGTQVSSVAEKDGKMLRVTLPSGNYQCLQRYHDTGNGTVITTPTAGTPRPGRCS